MTKEIVNKPQILGNTDLLKLYILEGEVEKALVILKMIEKDIKI